MYTSVGKAAFRGLAQIFIPESDGENSSHDSPLTSKATLDIWSTNGLGLVQVWAIRLLNPDIKRSSTKKVDTQFLESLFITVCFF